MPVHRHTLGTARRQRRLHPNPCVYCNALIVSLYSAGFRCGCQGACECLPSLVASQALRALQVGAPGRVQRQARCQFVLGKNVLGYNVAAQVSAGADAVPVPVPVRCRCRCRCRRRCRPHEAPACPGAPPASLIHAPGHSLSFFLSFFPEAPLAAIWRRTTLPTIATPCPLTLQAP